CAAYGGLPAALLGEALGLGGCAYTLDAACASSLYALKLACEELASGRADAMLAGGVSRPECLYTQMGFSQLRALSASGRCAPFDESADGLVVGEGAVGAGAEGPPLEVAEPARGIERLAAGQRDRDGVHGEISEPQVDLDRRAAKRGDVDLPAAVAGDDAPGGELARELERMPLPVGRDPAGGLGGITVEGDVDVDDVGAEGGVADGAADQPGAIGDVAEPRPGDLDRRRLPESLLEPGQVQSPRHGDNQVL
ncbi:MAG: hypothetical protein EDQ89_11955, partial [Acidobacteria bacterium]